MFAKNLSLREREEHCNESWVVTIAIVPSCDTYTNFEGLHNKQPDIKNPNLVCIKGHNFQHFCLSSPAVLSHYILFCRVPNHEGQTFGRETARLETGRLPKRICAKKGLYQPSVQLSWVVCDNLIKSNFLILRTIEEKFIK